MIELIKLGLEVQDFLQKQKWSFYFIGGIAVLRWGEPRFTVDIDLTLITRFGNEETYIDLLLERFAPRCDNIKEFALQKRVLLLKSDKSYPIDIALGALPFEESAAERSSYFEFAEGIELRTCSAEDLIVMKAFAERERDWADINGILIRQAGTLDWQYIEYNLTPLVELKESPHILIQLKERREKYDHSQCME